MQQGPLAAKDKNYLSRVIPYNQSSSQLTEEDKMGLEARFQRMKEEGYIGAFKSVDILEGFTEEDIWEIFSTIVNELDALQTDKKGGKSVELELYFDITNGFRFFPMLMFSLINYVSAVQNCKLKQVLYGNYDAGMAVRQEALGKLSEEQKAELRQQAVEAPIQILTNIVELNQWTEAVEMFTKSADAYSLNKLLKDSVNVSEKKLGEELFALTEAVKTCRGKELTQKLKLKETKKRIQSLKMDSSGGMKKQLKPLLNKIESKINNFNSKTTENGFAAVEWCIQHGMVQQGYTFLQETLISWLIEQTYNLSQIDDKHLRDIAKSALRQNNLYDKNGKKGTINFCYKNTYWYPFTREQVKDKANDLTNNRKKYRGLDSAFLEITSERLGGLRNDINHSGYNKKAGSAKVLTQELQNLSNRILQIIQPSYK
ncbi:TM1812 family CRISPR-associated protein [Saprospira sp. CCB-QB6]|uniref:TM1812 family CRISPR-associated protein n=1 Tax=Saprospira sp. CCB-QB6 TaxID=3023936 RepID=UPI0023490021|nr:TM1812 family CRISPR-associated protein [Saprospira sp. CCB-QB6]WCL81790.1 TM1812 family CRISPR-associated protein [Saprospira sp. CCB-QB6]